MNSHVQAKLAKRVGIKYPTRASTACVPPQPACLQKGASLQNGGSRSALRVRVDIEGLDDIWLCPSCRHSRNRVTTLAEFPIELCRPCATCLGFHELHEFVFHGCSGKHTIAQSWGSLAMALPALAVSYHISQVPL